MIILFSSSESNSLMEYKKGLDFIGLEVESNMFKTRDIMITRTATDKEVGRRWRQCETAKIR